jgi:pre-mRNA-processing factor 39
VSEDELPSVSQEQVKDVEEVSDDELPGPKLAELPADTEIVSEEELPSSTKKRKADDYDPSSPTETPTVDCPEKKAKTVKEEEKGENIFEIVFCLFF